MGTYLSSCERWYWALRPFISIVVALWALDPYFSWTEPWAFPDDMAAIGNEELSSRFG